MKNKGIAFKLAFFILTSCAAVFLVIFTYNYIFSRSIIVKNIENSARNLTLVTVNKIEGVLSSVAEAPESVAYFLEQSSYTRDELLKLLDSVVVNNAEIYGSTIAFEPYAFDKDSVYFAPYYYKREEKVDLKYLGDDSYRYFYLDWYQIPKELEKAVWSEPYFDEGGGGIMMSTYSVPFYKKAGGKKVFKGVVTADISLLRLQEIVSSIKIGRTGYGFLISRNGTFVTHPNKKFIMNETIFNIAEERGDSNLRAVGRAMVNGEAGFVPSTSIVTGKKCWVAYAPLPCNGWSLGAVFPQDELMADVIRFNRIVLLLGAAGLIFLFIVIVLISRSITRPLSVLARTTRDIAKGDLDFKPPPVRSKDEVGELSESFIYMRDALKKYIKDLTDTTRAKEKMESELRIARNIQRSLLPLKFPPFPKRTEFDVYALLEPAKEVGGDFYDFFFIDEDNLCFSIGDVSGKGVPAALFMAMVKTLIKTSARESHNPDEILKKVNDEISQDSDSSMFVTIFCGVLNTKTGDVYYANAGHNPPLLIRSGGEAEFFKGEGEMAIGLAEGTTFTRRKFVLGPRDAIYMYTDGVTEAMNADRQLFSDERLEKAIVDSAKMPVRDIVANILREIRSFTERAPQSDDITMLVLRYFGANEVPGKP